MGGKGKKLKTNSKSLEARERKAQAKATKQAEAEKRAEDAKWADEGTKTKADLRKQQAAEKRRQKLERDKEKREMEKEEQAKIAKEKSKKSAPPKVTHAQLEILRQQQDLARKEAAKKQELAQQNIVQEDLLQPNLNRVLQEQQREDEEKFGKGNVISASGLDDALQQLTVDQKTDRFPEKRLKQAHKKWEEENIDRFKLEHPHAKHSQLKQIMFKEWQKSPENPLNQRD